MKTVTKILFLCGVIILMAFSCDKKDDNSNNEGKIVFYTNAQAILNCGPFNVDIYIDNDSVGSISEPYIEDTHPDCINSTLTVMLEKKTGKYNYTAKLDCGQYGEWSGEFEIIPDSCTFIYLDINQCNPKND